MSFKQNDNNNTIHLGNYEEFFVLYMDNELNDEQMKMVDDFLAVHPDLQGEFEMLMNTRLPAEEFSFNKEDLMADSMKLNTVSEELLLYIDNELPAEQSKIVELELSANTDYHLQHQLLLKAKLDAAENIVYPNKEELYHRTERRIGFRPWMRIAAAALVIAAMGVVYFSNSSSAPAVDPGTVAVKTTKPKESNTPKDSSAPTEQVPAVNEPAQKNTTAQSERKDRKKTILPVIQKESNVQPVPNEEIAYEKKTETPVDVIPTPDPTRQPTPTMAVVDVPSKAFLNNASVTSAPAESYDNTNATENIKTSDVASNEGRGSVKGFLRKATRMIEKRTGIDATNDDGKLLIGAVALKLK